MEVNIANKSVKSLLLLTVLAVLSVAGAASAMDKAKCAALASVIYPDLRVDKTEFLVDEKSKDTVLPPHCALTGFLEKRVGTDGEKYATGHEMRLPADLNERVHFQGGGVDGSIRPALGTNTQMRIRRTWMCLNIPVAS